MKLGKAPFIYTFAVVVVGFVFFKTEHFHHSMYFLQHMFSFYPGADTWRPDTEYIFTLIIAIFFSFFAIPATGSRIQQKIFFGEYSIRMHYLMATALITMLIIS